MYLVKNQAGEALSSHADVVSALRASKKLEGSQVFNPKGRLISTAIKAARSGLGAPKFSMAWGSR